MDFEKVAGIFACFYGMDDKMGRYIEVCTGCNFDGHGHDDECRVGHGL